jgi:hypothetical protein
MLTLVIPASEAYDDDKEVFISVKAHTLQLEHSLVSISKWESKWHKPFLGKDNKTLEESSDYVRCMTTNQNVDPLVYEFLTQKQVEQVSNYIAETMTATTFANEQKAGSREVITAELIYYWMISFNIPFECQKWHLNRLLTLVNVCNIKNTPPKKMGKHDVMKRNASLNAARKSALQTKG